MQVYFDAYLFNQFDCDAVHIGRQAYFTDISQ